MARLFTDGAESGDMLRWNSYGNASATTSQKRTGNYSYYGGDWNANLLKTLPSTYTELFVRVAIRVLTANTGNGSTLIAFKSDGNQTVNMRLIAFGNPGQVGVYVGNTLVATANIVIASGEWHVWEIRVVIGAAGSITLKYDGAQVITYSGDTRNGQSSVNQVFFNGTSSSVWFDDIAINDTSGATDNSWCGDGGVLAALVPNGAGNYTDLIASAGSAYACVDEIPQNGDTDYVYESTVDKKSTFTMTDVAGLPTGASIARVWTEVVGKQSAADGDKIATLLRSGTTDAQGSDQNLTLAYNRFVCAEHLTDPADGTAWTTTKLNAVEAGAVVR